MRHPRSGITLKETLCPLIPDNPEIGHSRADPILIPTDIPRHPPAPDRWSLRSDMPPNPGRARNHDAPALCIHMAVNNLRILRGERWGLWEPERLYQLALQREPERPERIIDRGKIPKRKSLFGAAGVEVTEEEGEPEQLDPYYKEGVTLRSMIEAATYDGLGSIESPWIEKEPIENSRIEQPRRLTSIPDMEAAIRHFGGVVIAFDWYHPFSVPLDTRTPGVLHTPIGLGSDVEDIPDGRGCLTLYGYESRRLRFKGRAAMGEGYGRRGDVDISYPEVQRQMNIGSFDAWLLTLAEE